MNRDGIQTESQSESTDDIRKRLLERAKQLAKLRSSNDASVPGSALNRPFSASNAEMQVSRQPVYNNEQGALSVSASSFSGSSGVAVVPNASEDKSKRPISAGSATRRPAVPKLELKQISSSSNAKQGGAPGISARLLSPNVSVGEGHTMSARGSTAEDRQKALERIRQHKLRESAKLQNKETTIRAAELSMKVERQRQHLETLRSHEVAAARGVAQTVKSLSAQDEADKEKRRVRFEKWQLDSVSELRRMEEGLAVLRRKCAEIEHEWHTSDVECSRLAAEKRAAVEDIMNEHGQVEAQYKHVMHIRAEAEFSLKTKLGERDREEKRLVSSKRKVEGDLAALQRDALESERRHSDERAKLERERRKLESEISKLRAAVKRSGLSVQEAQEAMESHESKKPKFADVDDSASSSGLETIDENDDELWTAYLLSDGDAQLVLDRQSYRELQQKLKAARKNHDSLMEEQSELQRKINQYAREYSVEWESAGEILDWEARSASMMAKEDALGSQRKQLDSQMETLRNDLKRRALENEERKSNFTHRQSQYQESRLKLTQDRAYGEVMVAVRQEDLSAQQQKVSELSEQLKASDAREKMRFSVLLKQERWVDAEQKKYDSSWKNDYRISQGNLRSAVSNRKGLYAQLVSFFGLSQGDMQSSKTLRERRRSWLTRLQEHCEGLVQQRNRVRSLLAAEQEALVQKQNQMQEVLSTYSAEGTIDVDRQQQVESELKELQTSVVRLSEEARLLHMQQVDDQTLLNNHISESTIDDRFNDIGYASMSLASFQAEWLALEAEAIESEIRLLAPHVDNLQQQQQQQQQQGSHSSASQGGSHSPSASSSASALRAVDQWESFCGEEKMLLRQMQESILDHEAKMRLMDRWRSHAAEENAAEATQVAVQRAAQHARFEQEKSKLYEMEAAFHPDGRSENHSASSLYRLEEEWKLQVTSEKARLDAFSAYVAQIEAQLAVLLEKRKKIQQEWASMVEQNRAMEEARRIATASLDVRLSQVERDAMDKYRRQYLSTFDTWRKSHGEAQAEILIQQHMERVVGIYRQQVTERQKYFQQVRRRLYDEVPRLVEVSKKEMDSFVEELSHLRTRFHGHLKRIHERRIDIWNSWKRDRELFVQAAEEARTQQQSLVLQLQQYESQYQVVVAEETRLGDRKQRTPGERSDREDALTKEKFAIEEEIRKFQLDAGRSLAALESQYKDAVERASLVEKEFSKIQNKLREAKEQVRGAESRMEELRKQFEGRLHAAQAKVDRREAEIRDKRKELDKAVESFSKDLEQDEQVKDQQRKTLLRATSKKRSELQAQVQRLEQELAHEEEWLERSSETGSVRGSAPTSPRNDASADGGLSRLPFSKRGSDVSSSASRTETVARRSSSNLALHLDDFDESPVPSSQKSLKEDQHSKMVEKMFSSSAPVITASSGRSVVGRFVGNNERRITVHAAQIADRRVFGPYADPLSLHDLENLQTLLVDMLEGLLVFKRTVNGPGSGSGSGSGSSVASSATPTSISSVPPAKRSQYMMLEGSVLPVQERVLSVSSDLTRLEIRDPSKKVPESYIRIDHIVKIFEKKGASDLRPKSADGTALLGFVFVIVTKDKPLDFLVLDENIMNAWLGGIDLLIKHQKHLFYLKYNLKFILGDDFLQGLRDFRTTTNSR
eukprot:ANDGO_07107.mRNA.1 hypothetical protein